MRGAQGDLGAQAQQGVDGLLLGDATGLGSAVVWSKDGQVFFVGGPLRDNEVLDIANGLK